MDRCRSTVHQNGGAQNQSDTLSPAGHFPTTHHHQLCGVRVALLNINENHNFIQSIIYGFGAAVSFSLVLILFASMRERIHVADVPTPFKGASIAMITAGLMSLAFMGFTGLVKL